jgi:DNA-binding IclR family transcriptional regulator
MEDISLVVHAPVRLGKLADGGVSYIEKAAVHRPVGVFSDDGTAPIHATAMGKALLAFSPAAIFDLVVSKGLKAFTPNTIISIEDLAKAMASIRLSRFAVSRSEWMPGLSALAVPVFGAGGRILAALEVTVRDLRTDLRTLHPVLIVAARGLSREMSVGNGYDRAARLHRGWGGPLRLAPTESARPQTARL